MEIKGKTVLITGCAKRIGRELAINLAKDGANIVIHYNTSEEEALLLKQQVESFSVKALLVKANLLIEEEIINLVNTVKSMTDIDILINNASLYYKTPLESASFEDLDRFYTIHVKAPFYLSKEFGKIMFEKKYGRIINIADYSGILPYPDYTPYTVSKGAMLTMTKAFAKEFAPYVLVNAVLPGPVIPAQDLEDREIPLRKTVLKKMGRWNRSL